MLIPGLNQNFFDPAKVQIQRSAFLGIYWFNKFSGSSHNIPSHVDILSQNIIEEAISNPQPPNDPSAMQAGSSLGSLFLDSVDEMLSNEKTTLQFASPQAQGPVQRPKPKAKKNVQRKAAIDSSPVSYVFL